ncbi:hypothetical protein D3C73_1123320 [compost metagenome]
MYQELLLRFFDVLRAFEIDAGLCKEKHSHEQRIDQNLSVVRITRNHVLECLVPGADQAVIVVHDPAAPLVAYLNVSLLPSQLAQGYQCEQR